MHNSPYRDPPSAAAKWHRIQGPGGFIINLNDVYICKWASDSAGRYMLVAFKHGGWWMDGHRHQNIKVYGTEAMELERALLNLDR